MLITEGDNNTAKSPTSPPTYAQVVAGTAERPPEPRNAYHVNAQLPPPGQTPQPHMYGPTPIGATATEENTVLLPYYDPRSPWALEEGVRRAQRRFWGAWLWGVLIYLAAVAVVGGMVGERRLRRGWGRWAMY